MTQNLIEYHETVAVALPRIFLGMLFLAQGYDKAFNVGIRGVADAFEYPANVHHVSRRIVYLISWITTYAELIGGTLLILGLFRYPAMYLLSIDLLLAGLAFSIVKPLWDMRHIFPRLLLLIILLLTPPAWDVFSLDHLIHRMF